MDNQRLGLRGEYVAKAFLEHQGYIVLDCNWRFSRTGELDLVVYLPQTGVLSFVEVKTRKSKRYGSALESVTPTKQATIRQLAEVYLSQKQIEHPIEGISFDVITVTQGPDGKMPTIEHISDAF